MTRFVLLLTLAACSKPCGTLAERTCARAGQQSAVCKQVQEVAQAPTADDVKACEAGLAFFDEVERK